MHTARRVLAYGIASFGLITTLTAMAALHPYEHVYFNALVDTKTPGALGERYAMDYYRLAHRQLLEYLLARYPDDTLRVWIRNKNQEILPQSDRERIVLPPSLDADFYLYPALHRHWNALGQPAHYAIQAYGSVIAFILAPNTAAYRDYYRAEYEDAEANGDLLARTDFDIYAHNGALYYLKENCDPLPPRDPVFRIFLHIFPADPADLPARGREFGFENRDFRLDDNFGFFDGKCVHRHLLPDYPIARVRTGNNAATPGYPEWRADIGLAAHAAARAVHDRIVAGDYGLPVAQSDFDVYVRGNGLAYLKEPCAPGDTDSRLFLHITPANPADMPADRRERGFVNMDFRFADHGGRAADKCVATRDLPDYPIALIRTGQKSTALGGDGWRTDIDLAARAAAQAVYDSIAAGDYGQPVAQSNFDLYLRGNSLAYLKEPCAEGDTAARFFLHIVPANTADLPAGRRERGFRNLDFQFADHGERVGDKCVATRDLPDYPIDRIRTGQFVSGEGQLWGAEFPSLP